MFWDKNMPWWPKPGAVLFNVGPRCAVLLVFNGLPCCQPRGAQNHICHVVDAWCALPGTFSAAAARDARRWGRTLWRPWALSLGVELAAAQLLAWGARVQRTAAAEAAAEPALAFGSISLLYSLQAHRLAPHAPWKLETTWAAGCHRSAFLQHAGLLAGLCDARPSIFIGSIAPDLSDGGLCEMQLKMDAWRIRTEMRPCAAWQRHE